MESKSNPKRLRSKPQVQPKTLPGTTMSYASASTPDTASEGSTSTLDAGPKRLARGTGAQSSVAGKALNPEGVTALLRRQNATIPILRLPQGVMVHIFDLYLTSWLLQDVHASKSRLALVCFNWFKLWKDTPLLWGYISNLDPKKKIDTCLNKSGSAPLLVKVQGFPSPMFTKRIKPHINRVCYLQIVFVPDMDITNSVYELFEASTPTLNTLVLKSSPAFLTVNLAVVLVSAPQLRELHIEGVSIPWSSLALCSLTHLKIHTLPQPTASLQDVMAVIASSPCLVELELVDFAIESSGSLEHSSITLPFLKRIDLQGIDVKPLDHILTALQAPQCRYLNVSHKTPSSAFSKLPESLPQWIKDLLAETIRESETLAVHFAKTRVHVCNHTPEQEMIAIAATTPYVVLSIYTASYLDVTTLLRDLPLGATTRTFLFLESRCDIAQEGFLTSLMHLPSILMIIVRTGCNIDSLFNLLSSKHESPPIGGPRAFPFPDLAALVLMRAYVGGREILDMIKVRYGQQMGEEKKKGERSFVLGIVKQGVREMTNETFKEIGAIIGSSNVGWVKAETAKGFD